MGTAKKLWFGASGVLVILIAAYAQTPQQGETPRQSEGVPASQPEFRGNPLDGFETIRLEAIQSQLHASDEEWKVIGPKLRTLIAARRAVETGIRTESTAGEFGPPGDFAGSPDRGVGGSRGARDGSRAPGGGGPGGGRDSFSGPAGPGEFGQGGRSPERPRFGSDSSNRDGTTRSGERNRNISDTRPRGQASFPSNEPPPRNWPDAENLSPPPSDRTPNATTRPAGDDRTGGFGRRRPGGGPPGGGSRTNAVTRAMAELQTALADSNSTPELIQEKVATVRSARKKAMAEFLAAQKDILPLLTPDQEAVLVSLGILD